MAAKKKSNGRRPPVHLQVGQARHTDETIVLRSSKSTVRRLLKLADGKGVLNLTEEDLVAAIDNYIRPKAEAVASASASAERMVVNVPEVEFVRPEASKPEENILEEAMRIIYGDREQAYGSPRFNLDTIAQFWSVYIDRKFPEHAQANGGHYITAEDVAQLMILLKTARLIHNPTHRDSLVDQAGYAALQNRIQVQ